MILDWVLGNHGNKSSTFYDPTSNFTSMDMKKVESYMKGN